MSGEDGKLEIKREERILRCSPLEGGFGRGKERRKGWNRTVPPVLLLQNSAHRNPGQVQGVRPRSRRNVSAGKFSKFSKFRNSVNQKCPARIVSVPADRARS